MKSKGALKDQNRLHIWGIAAANGVLLYLIVQANAISLHQFGEMFTDAQKLIPVGFAIVFSTVLNGLISADMKARLVFLRWRYALPGHRAFTMYARTDPRIDFDALAKKVRGSLPADPAEQNRVWYRLYKTVENVPAVVQVHRDFLLTRDYTALSVLFFVLFGGIGIYAITAPMVMAGYLAILVAQFLLVRLAAAHYGVRLVTTVLAAVTTQPRGKPKTS